MSGPRAIRELQKLDSIQNEDNFVVEQIVDEETSNTTRITYSQLKSQIIKGPFEDDAEASSVVDVGHMYYKSNGEVRVRTI